MKILLSIAISITCFTANAQINQKTIDVRKRYGNMASFYPKQNSIFRFKNDYVRHDRGKNNNILSTAGLPRPSLHSIQKAFEYYNNQKHTDYSAFVTMGYALISKEHLIISNTPQEPIRFFPANIKD